MAKPQAPSLRPPPPPAHEMKEVSEDAQAQAAPFAAAAQADRKPALAPKGKGKRREAWGRPSKQKWFGQKETWKGKQGQVRKVSFKGSSKGARR